MQNNGIVGSFLDLLNIVMELHVKLVQAFNSAKLAADSNVALVNGLSNTIYKLVTVFINEKMVEANHFFNYSSYYIRLLKNMSQIQVS